MADARSAAGIASHSPVEVVGRRRSVVRLGSAKALLGMREEIRLLHRLTRKAMRIGDMKALAAGLDAQRDAMERKTAKKR